MISLKFFVVRIGGVNKILVVKENQLIHVEPQRFGNMFLEPRICEEGKAYKRQTCELVWEAQFLIFGNAKIVLEGILCEVEVFHDNQIL